MDGKLVPVQNVPEDCTVSQLSNEVFVETSSMGVMLTNAWNPVTEYTFLWTACTACPTLCTIYVTTVLITCL